MTCQPQSDPSGGQETLSGWPLPTWVQKEIDVYPCVPGEATIRCRVFVICVTHGQSIVTSGMVLFNMEAVVLDNGGNATTCKPKAEI